MLKHADIWRAIDRLAAKHGMSASGLARRAGLDPTTFNKSKRITKAGKERWPSTESVAKVLTATGTALSRFVALIDGDKPEAVEQRIPVVGYEQAANPDLFDPDGKPSRKGWDEILFPHLGDPDSYALEVLGPDLAPLYREGDIIVVSPAADVRRGDRVVLKTANGAVTLGQLVRESARKIEIKPVGRVGENQDIDANEVVWMSRIVWASQ